MTPKIWTAAEFEAIEPEVDAISLRASRGTPLTLPRGCWPGPASGSVVESKRLKPPSGLDQSPSVADFQTIELLRIVDRFAERFEDLPELIPRRSDYRGLLVTGVLVRSLNVVSRLAPDCAVELISFDHPVVLEEGMVFALETYWLARDGWSAARIEEEVVVTADGCEAITRFPAEDLLVFGTRYWTFDGALPRCVNRSRTSTLRRVGGSERTRED
jgi:hypothetical protein